ncbi:hypothetical protein [Mycobacterium sp.]|uniref:hypothetical protein n=1 Tax=Mycobacterium sp. TaxID=1785 RepID=UPI003F98A660
MPSTISGEAHFLIRKLMASVGPVADAAGSTTRRRHFVTETDELTEALDEAARRWPNVRRPQQLLTL